jgi:hypothetical protein
MSTITRGSEARAEFWRPAVDVSPSASATSDAKICARCSSELLSGAHFCHVCGAASSHAFAKPRLTVFLKLWSLLKRAHATLALNTLSLIAFSAAMLCLLAAAFTSAVFQVQSVLDWQAIQAWRIQWLLAAIAALVAGLLLKRSHSTRD